MTEQANQAGATNAEAVARLESRVRAFEVQHAKDRRYQRTVGMILETATFNLRRAFEDGWYFGVRHPVPRSPMPIETNESCQDDWGASETRAALKAAQGDKHPESPLEARVRELEAALLIGLEEAQRWRELSDCECDGPGHSCGRNRLDEAIVKMAAVLAKAKEVGDGE